MPPLAATERLEGEAKGLQRAVEELSANPVADLNHIARLAPPVPVAEPRSQTPAQPKHEALVAATELDIAGQVLARSDIGFLTLAPAADRTPDPTPAIVTMPAAVAVKEVATSSAGRRVGIDSGKATETPDLQSPAKLAALTALRTADRATAGQHTLAGRPAAGKPPSEFRTTAAGTQFKATARFEGTQTGRVELLILKPESWTDQTAQTFAIRYGDLFALVRGRLSSDEQTHLAASMDSEQYVTFNDLRRAGFAVRFNRDDELEINGD